MLSSSFSIQVVIEGEFERIEPPNKLVYTTWRMGRDPAESSLVTVRFEPRDNATEVIVVHAQLATEQVRESHEHGWLGCLDGLQRQSALVIAR